MLKIAITGGIGSGKTAVCRIIEECGYAVISADEISRSITAAGGKAIPYIRENFGDEFVLSDGSMDRAKMRELVYRNPEAKKLLEKGTTAVVVEDVKNITEQAEKSGKKALFYEIPLLFEMKMQGDYDYSWLITADLDIRIERIKNRDSLDKNQIMSIIIKQVSDSEKLELCDEHILNNGDIEELRLQVQSLLRKYSLI